MMNRKVKRGEIYWFDFGENSGSVQRGLRPALVIQADTFNAKSPTTIIAAITSVHKGMHLPSHVMLGEKYGLERPSMVMLEQIRTVNQTELGSYIGAVDDEPTLNAIAKALKKTYGMWFYKTGTEDIRCLCSRCLSDYIGSKEYHISRRDPFQKEREACDRCHRPGYDYILKPRRKNK